MADATVQEVLERFLAAVEVFQRMEKTGSITLNFHQGRPESFELREHVRARKLLDAVKQSA